MGGVDALSSEGTGVGTRTGFRRITGPNSLALHFPGTSPLSSRLETP